MNTAKRSSGGGPLDPPSNKTLLDPIIHINTEKNHYQNIPATKYAIVRASSLQNVMQNTLPPPPPPSPPFFFFFFCFFKKMLRLKINILSSVYSEINFLAWARDENK